MGGPVLGREGARQNLEMILRAFPDLKLEVEEIIANGNTVVTRLRMIATHKGAYAGIAATNKSVVLEACNVAEIRNGKSVRGRLYADNAKLLQQLGALSLPGRRPPADASPNGTLPVEQHGDWGGGCLLQRRVDQETLAIFRNVPSPGYGGRSAGTAQYRGSE